MEMIIGGKGVKAASGKIIEVLNPATGQVIDTVPRGDAGDVDKALDVATKGRQVMREMPAHKRSEILMRAANLIAARQEELSQLLCKENGKTIRQCRAEMVATQRLFVDFAEEAKRLRGYTIPMDAVAGLENMVAYTIRHPLGLIVGIVPFNYPAELFAHKIPGALAGGNSVIVKLPEQCPLTVLQLGFILLDAGLPPEALQMITGYPADLGDRLISDPEVAMVSFTGGVKAARAIARVAAQSLKRTAFELGGVDAMIVLANANLDAAATAVVQGRLTNGAGQICCAVKRVLVQDSVMDPFLKLLLAKVKEIKMGDPALEETDLGPLISSSAAEKVDADVQRSIAMGARCLIGGERVGQNFYKPTVLIDVKSDMPCMVDEVFGPVAPVVSFSSPREAIQSANDSCYGLQASVFSENIHDALGVAHRLEVGGVVINGPGSFRPGNVPFGGFKQSGIGRESITHTILEMTHETAVVLNQRHFAE